MVAQAAIHPNAMPIMGGLPFGAMHCIGLRLDMPHPAKQVRLQPRYQVGASAQAVVNPIAQRLIRRCAPNRHPAASLRAVGG